VIDAETETRVVEKAEYIEGAVSALARKRSLERDEYLQDREQRAVVEREFQTAIEACLDIAELLIVACAADVPDTNAETFAVLAELVELPVNSYPVADSV